MCLRKMLHPNLCQVRRVIFWINCKKNRVRGTAVVLQTGISRSGFQIQSVACVTLYIIHIYQAVNFSFRDIPRQF